MVAWRSAGLNYVRFSQIAAQVTRKCFKGQAALTAAKKGEATLTMTRWESGKPVKN